MNTEQRLDLIRARLKHPVAQPAKPAGLHRAAHPELPTTKIRKLYSRPWVIPPKSYFNQAEPELANANRPGWVMVGHKKKREGCRIKRKARVNPLTRISEQLPMKLPVISAQ